MQVSNCSNGMQDSNENNAKKVNKKVSNSKMSKSQKANSNSTPETESPQNVRLDTSESDEESVSEVKHHSPDGLKLLRRQTVANKKESCEKENFQFRPSFHRL